MGEIQVPKEIETKVATIESDVQTFEEKAKAMVINTAEDNNQATEILGVLTKRKKSIEEARKFFVDPLNAQVKAINAKFKPQTTQVDSIISIVKQKVGAYHLAEEEKRAKEQARKDAIRAKANEKRIAEGKEVIETPVNQVEEVKQTNNVDNASATVKKVTKHRIIDVDALPDNIKATIMAEAVKKGIADTVVRKFVNAGMTEISGVEIYQTTEVAVKA